MGGIAEIGAAGTKDKPEGSGLMGRVTVKADELSNLIKNVGKMSATGTGQGDVATTTELTKQTLQIGVAQAEVEMLKGGVKTAEKQVAKAGQALTQG